MMNLIEEIKISDIYDKNVNFLIGSGASHGLLPTLALNLKGANNSKQTIETLATTLAAEDKKDELTLLFAHYFESCIKPAMVFDPAAAIADVNQNRVIQNYRKFLETLFIILQRKKQNKICNVFTTNYDGCFVHLADELQRDSELDFSINDGAFGFGNRIVEARNFNKRAVETGVFDRHQIEIPQINLIPLHGSAYWYKDDERILVQYSRKSNEKRCGEIEVFKELAAFSHVLMDENKTIADLPAPELDAKKVNRFWTNYNKLPIVNPTKWKFHETVFEEHYYQMLRYLSYELEKPDTIFVTFGFSFADEHILNLVKRSLSNPKLQLFVCCFNQAEQENMKSLFKMYKNVSFVSSDADLDFSLFNEKVFSLDVKKQDENAEEHGAEA